MTKRTTKKALALSVLSVMLCCAMLVGSTFAWFTDTATAGTNKIVAGNLDVELLDADDNTLEDSIFDEDFLWEPGVMEVSKEFKVANKGNLALVYDLSLSVVEETLVNGRSLSDVIGVKVVAAEDAPALAANATSADRAEAWEALAETDLKSATLEAGETSDALVVVLYWAPNANEIDNLYNLNDGTYTEETAPSITFALNVFATQAPVESDSFGTDYDANAMAQWTIHQAVVAGVGTVNNYFAENDMADEYHLSELIELEAGKYQANFIVPNDVLLPENRDNTIVALYGLAQAVQAAVEAEEANISSITIEGNESTVEVPFENGKAPSGEDATFDGLWLLDKLIEAITFNGVAEDGYLDVTVTVNDIGGTSLTYVVHIAPEA